MIYTNVVKELKAAGATCVMFGGAVRDKVIGIEPTDFDFLVANIDENLLDSVLAKYGTLYVSEITLGLRKIITDAGTLDFVFCNNIDEHLAHKVDFTINTMTYDIFTQEIVDRFGGKEDISSHVLRLTEPKKDITHDPVLPIRAARFSAHLGFKIDPDTFQVLQQHAHTMFDLTQKERRAVELYKLFVKDNPRVAISVLMKLGIFDRLYAEYDTEGLAC